MFCHEVLAEFELEKCPELWVGSEDDMSATSAVTSVRTSFRYVFLPSHVGGTRTSIAGTAIYLHVVYEIAVCHNALIINYLALDFSLFFF